MATHGSIGEFGGDTDDWSSYAERMDQYFLANDVRNAEKKRAILLSVCGSKTYQLMRNLVAPRKPIDHSYDELVELVRVHYNPKPSEIVQRFKFNTRVRQAGESVATFIAELRQLSLHCNFGETLDGRLRDRLVCGINDSRIQRRLLSEAELDFKRALELAQAMESADRNAQDLQKAGSASGSTPMHMVRKKLPDPAKSGTVCYRCGGKHLASACRFKEVECRACGKRGHIARVCRSKPKNMRQVPPGQQKSQQAHVLQTEEDGDAIYTMFNLHTNTTNPLYVTVQANKKPLKMEIDTGASVSVISESTYTQMWERELAPTLRPSSAKLRTYTGEGIKVIGSAQVEVDHHGEHKRLSLLVVEGNGPSLLGRDWLSQLRLDWSAIHKVHETSSLQTTLDKHSDVFKEELGTVRGTTATIHVDPQACPRFCKPRSVPFSLKKKVEEELERLEGEGIIKPVQFSEWAAPIVRVLKSDGSVRICGDYKTTVNSVSKLDAYPIPRVEDLFTSMTGGVSFTKLDLSHAYQQLQLDESSRPYVTINTHKGLYQYTRLPFGVSSAPAIFQRTMENLLQGLEHVAVYIDDILITGRTETEHLSNLEVVLQRLEEAGMRLKMAKCSFMVPEVEYLGHCISKAGLQPTEEKVRAITEAPQPRSVSELKAFLGLINYYGKFLPNLATTLTPLYHLLQKVSWSWGSVQEKAFSEAKALLKSPQLLVHYDNHKELVLSCDASPYRVGAVLSHKMEDGTEQPIGFASRTLAPAERKYAQVDKEALAIVFGVKKFHKYLFGRRFTIYSDHKPLMHLFSESRAVPPMASARIQRWALILSAYEYSIIYKPGKEQANADGLSRLPLPTCPAEVPLPAETVLLMERLEASPVTATQIRTWTGKDPILAKVQRYVLHGWPLTHADEELTPYFRRREELSVEDGCILWGSRVVVPPQGRSEVMEEVHEGHPGISRMKSLARGYIWWPGMDAALERKVQTCTTQCSTAFVEVARKTLVPNTYRLCRTSDGQDVAGHR